MAKRKKKKTRPETVAPPEAIHPSGAVFASLFLVSAGVILWELILTRIYSVVLYYHYAFMAVSVAMFGLTLGAVWTQIRGAPAPEDTRPAMGRLALWTGSLMAASVAIQLAIPLRFEGGSPPPAYLAATYLLSAVPFVPAGAFFCLALTRFKRVGRLYAFDLVGAGLGCAAAPAALGLFGGPGAAAAVGAIACAGGFLLLRGRRGAVWGAALAVGLALLAGANPRLGWLKVRWRHNGRVPVPLHESWNAFSRIMVTRFPWETPFGWGIDAEHIKKSKPVRQLYLEIDSGAATPITRFDGDLEGISHLRLDATAFAHHLRPGSDVLVIGAGGGRDVLTALAFRQRSVRAVEMNPAIVRTVNEVFGDFSGHLDLRPDVSFVTDEGRSYLSRIREKFDIIQASFVDTVAATAAGAYAFTENGLYTVEAWDLFLSRLKPRGVLTFSRFYYGSTNWPVEVYRTLALAASALRARGIEDPMKHILLIRTRNVNAPVVREGVATLLLSPEPFSSEDLALARRTCRSLRCEIALSAEESKDEAFPAIVERSADPEFLDRFPMDISPPTDDRPYFFLHTRIGDVLRGKRSKAYGGSAFNVPAVRLMVSLVGIALALGLALVLLPPAWLAAAGRRPRAPGGPWFPLYFAGIGLAFMFVEIGTIQRLSLFLGHPTYGFTVALFGFLTASGLGSLASGPARERLGPEREWLALGTLVLVLAAGVPGGALLLSSAASAGIPVKILLALGLIAPPAFLMGFAFPMGMERAHACGEGRTAWFWAINGALSVVASVLAAACSLGWGIAATLWAGTALYAVTALLYRKLAAAPINPQEA